jgi:hypothetical protein
MHEEVEKEQKGTRCQCATNNYRAYMVHRPTSGVPDAPSQLTDGQQGT